MPLWMKYVKILKQWHLLRQNLRTLTTGDLKILLQMLMLKKTAEVELESQVRISGESIEEGEDEDNEDQDEDELCEDEIEKLLDGICADKIIDEMQARVDDFGQILKSVILKESFGDSM